MKRRSLAIVLLLVFAIFPSSSFAHNPEVLEQEGTVLLFQFDTGDPMYGAKLIVEDANGNELHHEFVKEDGLFDYGEYADSIHKIVVNDGGGHFIEFEFTDEMKQKAKEMSKKNEESSSDSSGDHNVASNTEETSTPETSTESNAKISKMKNDLEKKENNSLMYYILGVAVVAVVAVIAMKKNNKK